MKRSLLTLLAVLGVGSLALHAQLQRTCGTQEPCPEFETWIQGLINARMTDPNVDPSAVYTLPTIVHVIHNGEAVGSGRNISQTQINSQFDVLNEDYNKLNADFTTVCPSVFQPVAADCDINFCKALRDPNGVTLAEPGIRRINRTTNGWNAFPWSMSYIDNTIKPATRWDPTRYFNVWVIDIGNSLLGYASFPVGSTLTCLSGLETQNTSGVVCNYWCFGRVGNVIAPFNKGRTMTHEVGHWLGLRHIWGDSNCGSDCVTDTPTQQTYNFGCPSFPTVTCNNGPNGDMFVNYMDYTDDPCMVMFTTGQRTRIQTCMANGTYRAPLQNSTACNPTGLETYFTNEFSLYPNPSSGSVFVSSAFIESGLNIHVYNTMGEKILSMENPLKTDFEINLTGQAPGIYMIEFNSGDHSTTKKVMIR